MPKIPMIATRALTYGTRRLKADDEFEAPNRDARVLSALGKARARDEATAAVMPAAPKAAAPQRAPRKAATVKAPAKAKGSSKAKAPKAKRAK